MPRLVPVEGNPFAAPAARQPQLVPVEGDPFAAPPPKAPAAPAAPVPPSRPAAGATTQEDGVTFSQSFDRGFQSLATTLELLPYGLERGARMLLGDDVVNRMNAAAAVIPGFNPDGARGVLTQEVNKLNRMPRDPTLGRAAQAFDAAPGVGSGLVDAASIVAQQPSAISNMVAESLPGLLAGGPAAMGARQVALQVLPKVVAPKMVQAGANAVAGATLNAVGTAAFGGSNVAQEVEQGASIDEAAATGALRTIGEVPGSALAGALLPVAPFRGGMGATMANVGTQTVIQGLGEMASTAGGNAILGQPTSGGELAVSGLAGAVTAPFDMATELYSRRFNEAPQAPRLEPVEGDPFAAEPNPAAAAGAEGITPPAAPVSQPNPPRVSATSPLVSVPADPTPLRATDLRPDPGPLAEGEEFVTTPAGNKIRARPQVVDINSLTAAEGELQNRDRSRGTTDLQIQSIIAGFDPTRLGRSAETDRGAPIVGPDGVIESGNGRIMALRRIFAEYPEQAAAYRRFLEEQGYDLTGIETPVLVRQRTNEFTPEQRRQFVLDSNSDAKMALTSVERARGDADAMDADSLALYKGGDVDSAGNAEFVRAFMARLPEGERAAMIGSDNRLSADGKRRVNSALLARAYENSDILAKLLEEDGDNIKGIGNALLDNSANVARVRAAVKAGEVKPEFDITDKLVEAARIVSDLRARKENVADYLASIDAFNPLDPVTEQWIRTFYQENLKTGAGRQKIADVIEAYYRRAGEQTTAPSMFGDPEGVTPLSLLEGARRDSANPNLFAAAEERLDDRAFGDILVSRDGEMTPEFQAHLEDAQAEGEAIEARGGKPLFHGTSGEMRASDPRGLGMMFWAEDAYTTTRYAGSPGVARQYGVGQMGRILVREQPDNILDITTEAGLQVLSGLPRNGVLSARIVDAARRDLAGGGNSASDQIWSLTKSASQAAAADIRDGIVNTLQALGYKGIRFNDDTHATVAVFEETGNEADGNGAAQRAEVRVEEAAGAGARDRQRDAGAVSERQPGAGARRAEDGNSDAQRRQGSSAALAAKIADALDEGDVDEAVDYSEGRQLPEVQDKGAYQPSFLEASFTNRASIYDSAIIELGYDPADFRTKPPETQVALLSRGMMERFGIKISVDGNLQRQFAIDQLIDAYQNFQGMAHVLGISPKAMSLGGKLQLKLERKVRALGWFMPGKNVIGLPRRSNSFAHEWGHALDFFMLERLTGALNNGGLTGTVRKDGANFQPTSVREAFVKLLNAMFFDEAGMAAKIIELEQKIAATKSEKQKAAYQAQIDNFLSGRSQSRTNRSRFYQGARKMDRGADGYFATPTEMLARAFEAYVSFQAERAGLGTEIIGKGDANYLSDAEPRFELTFPKSEERERIFQAFDDLFAQIQNEAMLGKEEAAQRPNMDTLRRVTDLDRLLEQTPNGGLIRRELDAIEKAALQRRRAIEGRPNNPKGLRERMMDLASVTVFSMTGLGRMMERRYKGSKAIPELMDLLTYREGRGVYVGEGFEEAARARMNTTYNRLAQIVEKYGLDKLDTPEAMQLRDILIRMDTSADRGVRRQVEASVAGARRELVEAAADIRTLLNDEFYQNQKAGIDIGHAKNGYMPRMMDMPKIWGDTDKFAAKAGEVYKIVFDKEYGEDVDTIMNDEELLPRFLRLARRLAKEGRVDADAWNRVAKLSKDMAKIAQAAGKATDGDERARLEEALEKKREEFADALGEIFDQVRDGYAAERAEAWVAKLNQAADSDFDAHAPDSDYTKSRELPPEADKILEDFYISDPVEAVYMYLGHSARRTEYAKRFGAKGEKRKALFEQMAAEGVRPEDQRMLQKVLDIATGRERSGLPAPVLAATSAIHAFGTVTLLPRAVLSSLAESATVGIRSGDMRDSFKAISALIAGGAFKSQKGRQRLELARAMGLVTSATVDHINAARFGGTFGDSPRWTKLTARMFQRTGLTGLTNAQQTHALSVSHAYIDLMARRILEGVDVRNSKAMLLELGIKDPEAFAKEMAARGGAMPTIHELDTPWGRDYGVANRRFINQAIQQPNLMDRPVLANNPVGRLMYGILSFSLAFWRNVMKRNAIKVSERYKNDGLLAAASDFGGIAGAAVTLFAMQATISTIREYLLNRKRWEDLQEAGELESTMMQLAFTRTFAFGLADPVIQAFTGLKYQRDLSNILIGPVPGFFLQNLERMVTPFVRNSDKTNTAEYRAFQGFYSGVVSPAVAMALMMVPGGPIIGGLTGVGAMTVTSPTVRDAAADAVVGEKDGRKKKGG